MIDLNDDRMEGLEFAFAAALPVLGKVASIGSTVWHYGKKIFHHKKKKAPKPAPPPRPVVVQAQSSNNTILYLALAGAGLYLLTRRKR